MFEKKINIKKPILSTILLTVLIISTIFAALPSTSAHTPAWTIPTFAYIHASPNPVGVGQTVNILMWLDKVFDNALLINNNRFHNFNLTIVKPDGSTETKIFETVSDSTSSQGYSYTPQQTGTYTLLFNFPGQAVNDYTHDLTSAYVNDTYSASSAEATLTVQDEPIINLPDSYPLPSEYWTRPIYGENPYWWTISSNWLGHGSAISAWVGSGTLSGNAVTNFQRYPGDAVGSQTAHIIWTKPYQSGGVVGGNIFEVPGETFFDGSAYLQRLSNLIIVNGKIYYTEPNSIETQDSLTYIFGGPIPNSAYGPTKCVDLRTGNVVWSRSDVPPLSFAYLYDIRDPQQYGVYPTVLFSTDQGTSTWRAFDADTGDALFNVTGLPTGTIVAGPQGEQLRLTITNCGTTSNPQWYLAQWNSSKLWTGNGFSTDYSKLPAFGAVAQFVPTISGTVDASVSSGPGSRYDWNISLSGINSIAKASAPSVVVALRDDLMILRSGSLPTVSTQTPYTYFAISLKSGSIGSLLWSKTYNPPAGNITVNQGPAEAVNRVFVEAYKETMQFVGYSMDTGDKLWGPTASQPALDYYGNAGTANIGAQGAYGKLYSIGMSGILHCYDSKTGTLLWTYGNGGPGNSSNAGFETGQGTYPGIIGAVGNDVIYTFTAEHTVQTPIYKGSLTRAINATDGTEIWTLSGYVNTFITEGFAIADGFTVFPNSYDNQLYSVGRGPSATTVDAPLADITLGSGLVIRGTVTDISVGTTQDEQAGRFPNGVPVASDESMKDWMGYVYQQKPLPTSFTGVPVTISVVDSNGNYRTIGTTTTDDNGAYSLQWTPDIEGKYTVYATFEGTNGYWPSHAVTSFAVDPAQATPTPQATQPASLADQYLLPGIIGIIVAIIVVGIVLLLAIRKRP